MDRDRFRRSFPNLARELEEESSYRLEIRSMRDDPWRGYDPDVVDFIRRAETIDEAMEVISFLEKRGEITPERAEELKRQLVERGVRSFGPKKEPGYYLRVYLEEQEES